MEKVCKSCPPKASPRPIFNFGKEDKTANAYKKLFWKFDILKEDYRKIFKLLTSFFPLHAVPFYRQDYAGWVYTSSGLVIYQNLLS